MNPFNFLRRLAKAAVIDGIHDALAETAPEGTDPPLSLAELESRINRVALPAAPEPEAPAAKGKGKAVPK